MADGRGAVDYSRYSYCSFCGETRSKELERCNECNKLLRKKPVENRKSKEEQRKRYGDIDHKEGEEDISLDIAALREMISAYKKMKAVRGEGIFIWGGG